MMTWHAVTWQSRVTWKMMCGDVAAGDVAVDDGVSDHPSVPSQHRYWASELECLFVRMAWQVNFHLGVLDLDLALLKEKPADITDESSDTEKLKRKAWDMSNRLYMSFMQMNIANNIKTTLLESVTAKEYLKLVEERFRSTDKSLDGTLMAELTTMKYDGSRSMQQYVLEMTNTAARLKSLGMTLDDSFLMQFILNSLPPEYGPFQINYNTIKDKWDVNELSSKLT
ncbi:hypothetical protein BUALT_Bualt14G0059300 [Buddleja alternifolia]|uniref:UBN2_2 domain-containing protein n=1 Tax=Buddleja alternifolia TaxID=168488 RepID=A0AAV6WSH4_9LAMI|nr:hypothetical protein BUALT_Bualt14G0059300 [Buddleja alternifolia]